MTQDTIIQYTGPSTPWTWDGPKDTVDFHRLRTSCIGQLHLKCPRKIFKNRLPLLERQDRRNLHSEDGWCGGLPSLEVLQYQFLGLPSVTLNMGYGTKGDRILLYIEGARRSAGYYMSTMLRTSIHCTVYNVQYNSAVYTHITVLSHCTHCYWLQPGLGQTISHIVGGGLVIAGYWGKFTPVENHGGEGNGCQPWTVLPNTT